MGREVIVGIDGGATYSFGVAVDREGKVLATARSGSLNFLGNSLTLARTHLSELAASLKKDLPPGCDFNQICIGCAALSAEATEDEKALLCRGIFPLERTRVVSDALTAYHGACDGQSGILIIAGTGSMILAQMEQGNFIHVGGWGHLLGDAGSAFWIASEAIRSAIAARERTGPATELIDWICRWFKVNELTEIIPIVYGAAFTKDRFAALARYLADHVPADPVLQDIFRRAGQELARQAAVPLRQMQTNPVPVFFEGSVLSKNTLVRETLIAELMAMRPVKVERPALPPLLGAAGLALIHLGIGMDPYIVANLRGTYRELLRRKL